jgi:hypothetical protein
VNLFFELYRYHTDNFALDTVRDAPCTKIRVHSLIFILKRVSMYVPKSGSFSHIHIRVRVSMNCEHFELARYGATGPLHW